MEESLKFKTKKGLYWQFLNQAIDLGVQFIIGIILARLLSPEDYGITALPGVFLAIAGLLTDCGFGQALIRKPELTEKDLSTAFYYSICVGFAAYWALFASAGWIADFYKAPILKSVLRVTAITLFLGPIGSIQGIHLSRRLDFKTLTTISIICKFVTGIVGVVMAFSGSGIWSLVIPPVLSDIISIIAKCYVVRWFPKEKWSKDSFKYLWGFGSKMLLSYMIGTIYENLYTLIIGKMFSPAQLGTWNRAQNYAALPSKQATNILQRVTFPVLSSIQDEDERLAYNYRRILRVSAFVIFPAMLLLSALAEPLIIVLVTDKWEGAVQFLEIMCFSMMWYPIHAINLNLLQVKGRSDYFLKLEIIKRIIGIIILFVTIPMGLVAMAYGGIVSSVLSLFINTYYTGKLINVGIWKQLLDLTPTIIMSLVIYAISRCLMMVISNIYLQIIVCGVVSVVVYFGLALLLKRDELSDCLYLLKIRSK